MYDGRQKMLSIIDGGAYEQCAQADMLITVPSYA